MITRKKTRELSFGGVSIGGENPILIQSMTNTPTEDVEATDWQIRALEEAGCEAVRLAVPTLESAKTFSELRRRNIRMPLVADIHYDYRIALRAICEGADKIRINPGNIGSREHTLEVVRAAKSAGVPIRIGVNSGSLEESILKKHGAPTPEALVESALYHAKILEDSDFFDICISVKASNVVDMIRANQLLSAAVDYPIHLGVTEAGGAEMGLVKSSVFGEYTLFSPPVEGMTGPVWFKRAGGLVGSYVLSAANWLCIALSLAAGVRTLFKKNRLRQDTLLTAVLWVIFGTTVLMYVRMCFGAPHTCTQNFRYTTPLLLCGAVWLGKWTQDLQENGKTPALAAITAPVGVFCGASAWVYTLLGMK